MVFFSTMGLQKLIHIYHIEYITKLYVLYIFKLIKNPVFKKLISGYYNGTHPLCFINNNYNLRHSLMDFIICIIHIFIIYSSK